MYGYIALFRFVSGSEKAIWPLDSVYVASYRKLGTFATYRVYRIVLYFIVATLTGCMTMVITEMLE